MSRMLTSVCDELECVERLAVRGQFASARFLLLEFSLRGGVSCDEHYRIGLASAKLALRVDRFGEARRHLRMAGRLRPDEAEVHYLLGRTHEDDPHGCDRRAARHYRKATVLNASEPKYRAALGRALVRISNVRSGVKVLRRAAEAAPTDPVVLEIVREGLQEAEQSQLALHIMNQAMFLAPGDRQVKHLWQRAQYDATAERQKKNRKERTPVEDSRPVSLPFIRIHTESTNDVSADTKIIRVRRDAGEPMQARAAGLKAFRN